MLSINTNLSSIIAQRSMKQSTNKLNQAIERMTTGYKINHAKDNAANYSISTNMTTKIGSYNVAEDNCAMGLDMIATAEGSLSQIQDKLQRLRDLQEQASNGTYGEESLNAINAEVNALVDEINRIYSTAEYNGMKIFGANTSSPIATFAMTRVTTSEGYFISDPVSYTDEEVEAMTTMTQAVVEGLFVSGGKYSISTAEELVALADYVNSGNNTSGMFFVLGDDIDLSSISNWTPIGNSSAKFQGTFDGNGQLIKNLTIDNTTSSQGLFGTVSKKIMNVGIEGGSVKAKSAGGLVGYAGLGAEIINCYTTCEVSCTNGFTGGLVGSTYYSVIKNCYTTGDVSGSGESIGGLVGYTTHTTISNCYATGKVSGRNNFVGGLVGEASSETKIYSSFATGDVSSFLYRVGGLVGSTPDNIGSNLLEIHDSYATGNVSATGSCDGLIGSINIGSLIYNSYSSGSVTGARGSSGATNSDDWDGTYFTYDYASYSGNGSSIGGGGPSTPPTYTPDTILLQVGTSSNWGSQVGVSTTFALDGIDDLRMIGLDKTTDYLEIIDDMLEVVSEKQTHFGAVSNRLESVLEEIVISRDNLISSRSTLRDADIADISSEYIRQQILQQASATLLATANQSPSIALQLI